MKKKKNYVNNADLCAALIEYKQKIKEAEEKGLEKPGVSHYVGDCIQKIATNLAKKPNFSNYSFKDEMIFDGIENCLMYIHNFNPEKSDNAFSYITQIIYYAFLRRIAKEEKALYVKYKSFEKMDIENGSSEWNINVPMSDDFKKKMYDFIQNYEDKMKK